MSDDGEDVRRRALAMERPEDRNAREQEERATAALIGKALEPRGETPAVSAAEPNAGIPVLWFDVKGCGPDKLALELHPFPAEFDGRIPAYLGIRVRSGGLVIGATPLVDGGFNLGREQVAELHRQLGAWLEANP